MRIGLLLQETLTSLTHFFLKGPPRRIVYLRLGNVRNGDLTAFLEIRWPTIQALMDQAAGMLVVSREQLVSY